MADTTTKLILVVLVAILLILMIVFFGQLLLFLIVFWPAILTIAALLSVPLYALYCTQGFKIEKEITR